MSKKNIALRYDGFTIEAKRDLVAAAVLGHVRGAVGISLPAVAANDIPRIGTYWPGQGGIYAGPQLAEDGNIYHLIRAVDDISAGIAWGERGTELSGCADKWHGMENTKAMAAAGNAAAIKVLALEIDGHRDFFIPAQKQGQMLNVNAPSASVKKAYWTSTQFSSNGAWYQSFDGGYSYVTNKVTQFAVCAVRRFLAY